MSQRLEGSRQLNEILFQAFVDSFPLRNNASKITEVISSHADDLEALVGGSPSGAEVVAARDQEADLATAIRKADELVGDGIERGVLDDFDVVESAVPDDEVTVKTGSAIIDGTKVRNALEQTVDPPDFSLGITDPRIDLVHIGSAGTASTTTGLPAAVPLREQKPDNQVELAALFLRPSLANPNIPLPIKNVDDGTNSFVIPNLQKFLEQKDDTESKSHPHNLVWNGAGLLADDANVLTGWTGNDLTTFLQSATEELFGDFSIRMVGSGAGTPDAEFEMAFVEALKDRHVTASCYIKLAPGTVGKTARITIRMVGDTPEQDFSATRTVNDQQWTRLHVTGFIDNEVTQVFVVVEVDTTAANSTEGFVDGVQVQPGKVLTEFEFPPRVSFGKDGALIMPDLTLTGDLTVNGVANTDDSVVAYAAFVNSLRTS